jgi:leucyl aminopeptidase
MTYPTIRIVPAVPREEIEAAAGSAALYYNPPADIPAFAAELWSKRKASAKAGELVTFPTHRLAAEDYILIGNAGEQPESSEGLHLWRDIAAQAGRKMNELELEVLHIHIPPDTSKTHLPSIIYAVTEGLLLGSYIRRSYRSDASSNKMVSLQSASIVVSDVSPQLEHAIRIGRVYASATNYARDLTNLPGNFLYPELLAAEAEKLAERYDSLACEVLDEQQLEERGMSGLLAVGKGSARPPRMIALKYQGLSDWGNVTGLVGKGITFDTGGISLKKSEGMEEMISDMGGAAVVLGVMQALADLSIPMNAVAVIPSAENMPSGTAYRPGDIIATLSGKTIEVLNTDAEGRVVLADGMTYAKQLGAEKLIEVSTLTGAVLTVLGDTATAAVTNDESYLQGLLAACRFSGEKIWPLPAYPEYWELIKSDVADVKNSTSNRWAGVITGALFIGTFAEGTPWIHLDTGGTAWLWSDRGVDPKGGTGSTVRSILHFIAPDASIQKKP